jgi:hypothetical protein
MALAELGQPAQHQQRAGLQSDQAEHARLAARGHRDQHGREGGAQPSHQSPARHRLWR